MKTQLIFIAGVLIGWRFEERVNLIVAAIVLPSNKRRPRSPDLR